MLLFLGNIQMWLENTGYKFFKRQYKNAKNNLFMITSKSWLKITYLETVVQIQN